MTEIDVSNCTYYVEGECDIHQDSCAKVECQYKWYKRIEAENAKLKEALENVRKYLELTGILFDDKLLLDTNTQRAVDIINEVLKDE